MCDRYDYSARDDYEIHKELHEIASELIPHMMRSDSCLLRQPQSFAYLLRFYDGICQWEEGANTQVMHEGWSKPCVTAISKFDASVRTQVIIECYTDAKQKEETAQKRETSPEETLNNNNNYCKTKERGNAARDLIKSLESKVPSNSASTHPSIQALTAACSEKILNRDYLLQGDGEPFVAPPDDASLPPAPSTSTSQESSVEPEHVETETETENKRPRIILYSQKMKGLRDLLLAEKLNTQAISLHLTALSQVQVGKKTRGGGDDVGVSSQRPKRTRRE